MGLFKKARKFVKKIIPKEIRPFIPYIAAAFGPAGLAGTKFATLNPAFQKAILAGGTKFATDDEADLKDIGVTAALAAAPTALDQFAGPTGPDPQGIMGTLRKGSRALAQKAKDSPYLTMGAQASTDAAIKQAELDKDALEKYNADLLSQGIKDKGARRSAIFDIFINAGHDSDDVNIMLDKYGYADGGRIGFKSGDYVGSSNNETMKDEYDSYIKEIEIDGDKPMSFSSFKKMLSEDYADGGRTGYRYGKSVKKKKTSINKKAPPSAGIMSVTEVDAEIDKDEDKDQMSMKEFVEMMKGGDEDEGMSLGDSLDYAKQGLGMLQGDVAPVPIMRFADGGFGGITEAVKNIEEKPKEFLVDKLKVTVQPGQSEMRAIIEAMYNDMDGLMPEDRKREFYELYAPQMYRNGEMEKPEFEFIQTEILDKEKPEMKDGGSVTFEEFLDMRQKEDKQRSKDMLFKDYEEYKRREKIKEEKTMAKDGGIMNLGGKEMDMRGGGFIPIGKKERADDVPARLSKNEFVMTADAVRAAGGGSVNKGAKRMYSLMNNLEARV